MMKEDLLFYKEYEDFYAMAKQSKAFEAFCRDAFGEDFSQDGFSDVAQIDMILKYIRLYKTHVPSKCCFQKAFLSSQGCLRI